MKNLLMICTAIALLSGCVEKDRNGNAVDTPTSGSISIVADEALKPLIDAEVSAFEGIYRYANIDVRYTSEADAIDALTQGSVRLAIVTRKLAEVEKRILIGQSIVPHELALARDGVALIANLEASDSLMTVSDLVKILGGDIGSTTSLNKKSSTPISEVVFDQPNSGIIRFLRDSIAPFDDFPKYCFAVQSNSAVVDYVSKKPGALGLIDVSWISDRDDSTAHSFLKSIRVLAVSGDSGSFHPHQAYMAQGLYPLTRDVVAISREARSGLASGFMAFVASDKGQRIVLKSGLVPATMPIRIVEVNHEPF